MCVSDGSHGLWKPLITQQSMSHTQSAPFPKCQHQGIPPRELSTPALVSSCVAEVRHSFSRTGVSGRTGW